MELTCLGLANPISASARLSEGDAVFEEAEARQSDFHDRIIWMELDGCEQDVCVTPLRNRRRDNSAYLI